jgi:GTP-binding protein HflX
LLLHVIDVSNPEWQQQEEVVEALIAELCADHLPRIDVLNKCDLTGGDIMPRGEDIVCLSARTGEGVDELLEKIDRRLDKGARRVTLRIPYSRGELLDMLYREAKVESVEYSETTDVVAVCTPKILGRVEQWIESKPID